MKTKTASAISAIRTHLGLTRLNPRRLFLIRDGAYTWIGDRADLNASSARTLRAVDSIGRRPDLATVAEREAADNYDDVCHDIVDLASTCGSGQATWLHLPENWRDGSALGDISPL